MHDNLKGDFEEGSGPFAKSFRKKVLRVSIGQSDYVFLLTRLMKSTAMAALTNLIFL